MAIYKLAVKKEIQLLLNKGHFLYEDMLGGGRRGEMTFKTLHPDSCKKRLKNLNLKTG